MGPIEPSLPTRYAPWVGLRSSKDVVVASLVTIAAVLDGWVLLRNMDPVMLVAEAVLVVCAVMLWHKAARG